jgi:NitT/TauT family transport system permease protein
LRGRSVARQVWPLALVLGVLLALWWALAAAGIWDRNVLPSPAGVWSSLWRHVADGSIPEAAGKTLLRLAFGFAVAMLFGTLLGIGLAASSFARRSVGSLVVALRVIPPIAVLPLAIVWFGFTERAVVFVTILGAFPSVTLAMVSSLRQVPSLYERAGRTLGASGWRLFSRIVFPAALPGYVAGLQQAWGYAWRSLMAGELLTRSAAAFGLGQQLARAQAAHHTAQVVAVLGVIVAIGVVVDLVVFRSIERRMRRRRGLLLAE